MAEKVIGILGGMGPEATLDCFEKIIRNTPPERIKTICGSLLIQTPRYLTEQQPFWVKGLLHCRCWFKDAGRCNKRAPISSSCPVCRLIFTKKKCDNK